MLVWELSLIYGTLGLAVGAAQVLAAARAGRRPAVSWSMPLAVAFWPLFLPFLLAPGQECGREVAPAARTADRPEDGPLCRALRAAEQSVRAGLAGRESHGPSGNQELQDRLDLALERILERARAVEAMERMFPAGTPSSSSAADPASASSLDLDAARAESRQRLAALGNRRRQEVVAALVRLEELGMLLALEPRSDPGAAAELQGRILANLEELSPAGK